ncbi:MAG: protein kinase [Rhodobacterales bacterium]|nr:protein kinase [Rhodobacterales bacterium]
MAEKVHGKVGPYQLLRLLATGSQSQVWLASPLTGDDAEVVLKVARTEGHRKALQRETKVLRLGSHPGLPVLHKAADDYGWIAMARIEGSQIDQWSQVQDLEKVLDVTHQLLDVLTYLHGHGVVHGDIKPSNVLIDKDGQLRLIDMGIATLPGDAPSGFKGTLGYAAPELLKGDAPSIPTTDLYGVGALLYTCICGRPPFVAPDPAALTYLPLVSLPAPPAALYPDIPAALNHLLLSLLSRSPKHRPDSIAEVKASLHKVPSSPPAKPILGMFEERDALRKAVVGAADGEPRVVVVYGPPGSGRRTLISEAVEFARREGLRYHKSSDIRQTLAAIKSEGAPTVAVLRGSSKNAQKLSLLILRDGLKALILLHADRPIQSIVAKGAITLTPSPLSAVEARRLTRMMNADEDLSLDWWREVLGLPIGLLGKIRAWHRKENGEPIDLKVLPKSALKILDALRKPNSLPVPKLASATGFNENELLDHCEVLFAEALIEATEDGNAIRILEGV